MKIRFRYSPYAWYLGFFYSTRYSTLYIQIIPLIALTIKFYNTKNMIVTRTPIIFDKEPFNET